MKNTVIRVLMLFFALTVTGGFLCAAAGEAAGKRDNFSGVCPPFFLRDESGMIINPVTRENEKAPYSPKQTCGVSGCHSYDTITAGYHFQQGKDEPAGPDLTRLYPWVVSPGQYGGRW